MVTLISFFKTTEWVNIAANTEMETQEMEGKEIGSGDLNCLEYSQLIFDIVTAKNRTKQNPASLGRASQRLRPLQVPLRRGTRSPEGPGQEAEGQVGGEGHQMLREGPMSFQHISKQCSITAGFGSASHFP